MKFLHCQNKYKSTRKLEYIMAALEKNGKVEIGLTL